MNKRDAKRPATTQLGAYTKELSAAQERQWAKDTDALLQ